MAKSRYSTGNSNCVDVVWDPQREMVGVSDTKQGDDRTWLWFTPDEWGAFIDGANDGDFDLLNLEVKTIRDGAVA